jgi:hypothetical protein
LDLPNPWNLKQQLTHARNKEKKKKVENRHFGRLHTTNRSLTDISAAVDRDEEDDRISQGDRVSERDRMKKTCVLLTRFKLHQI